MNGFALFISNIYIFLLAVVLAVLEIQIEGKHGWAKNLPTWRPKQLNFWTKLYSRVMSGKEMTGYHLSMFTFVILVFHLPYFLGLPWNIENWLKTVSLVIIFMALWDFLWFVLNPHYPLSKFKKEHLDFHHPQWFLGLPVDYYYAALVSFLVLLPAMYFTHDIFFWWGITITSFIFLTLLAVFFSLYILKIDKWQED